MSVARLTITMPVPVVEEIDRRVNNRSSFITTAVKAELVRRRTGELQTSLHSPHPECEKLNDMGVTEWAESLPADDWSDLVQSGKGKPVSWKAGQGWQA